MTALAPGVYFGKNQYISAGNVLQYERTQPWSFGCIMRTSVPCNSAIDAHLLFGNVDAAPFSGYELWTDNFGRLRVRIISTAGSNFLGVIGTTNVCDNEPHFVWATYDGSSTPAGVKLYVDGVQESTTTEANTLTGSIINSNPFYLGNQKSASYIAGFHTEGLGAVRMSDIVRDSTYIAANSDIHTLPAVDADTVLAYDFTEQAGTTCEDLSSHGYDGTLSSSSLWKPELDDYTNSLIQRVQRTGAGYDVSASARTTVFGSNVSAGNLIVVGVETYNTGITVGVTDSCGNTYTQAGSYATNGLIKSSLWYARNITGGACTITVTPSASAYVSIQASEYSGADRVSPLDSVATGTGTSTTPSTSALTVTNADSLVVACVGQAFGNTKPSVWGPLWITNMTLGPARANAMMADSTRVDAGFTPSWSYWGNAAWAAIAASFVAADTDATAPAIAAISIAANGTDLVIDYTEADSVPILPASGATGVTLSSSSGVVITVSSGTRTGSLQHTFPLSRTAYDNEVITLTYADGNITDGAQNALENVSDVAVTNGSEESPAITGVAVAPVVVVGTSSTITWSSVGIIGYVDVLLSLDGGSTFPITIVSNAANDGAHAWTPEAAQITAGGAIRVRSSSQTSIYDYQDVIVATTSGGVGAGNDLWSRLRQIAADNGLELIEP
jgi:hypothetical protein